MNSLVSVIVTTKNESSHIGSCLQSVVGQLYKQIEIIVVDNHSNDNTKKIASRFMSHIFDAGPERSAQRNFGAKMAKGEYVLFLDADMMLSPDVVKECVYVAKVNGLFALVIPERSIGIGFWAQCKALERQYYVGIDWMEGARFFNKNFFNTIGGYDEKLTGPEDFELPQRIKIRYGSATIGRISSFIIHDEGDLSLAKLLRKKYYYGRQMRTYRSILESHESFKKQAGVVRRFQLFFTRPIVFIRDPIHAFGMLYMKALEMAALSLGALIAK